MRDSGPSWLMAAQTAGFDKHAHPPPWLNNTLLPMHNTAFSPSSLESRENRQAASCIRLVCAAVTAMAKFTWTAVTKFTWTATTKLTMTAMTKPCPARSFSLLVDRLLVVCTVQRR
ncbi:uncharacterized protein EKO05_0005885 [Ascochyta rabiei]|uniref:uncharacterized protein n=1 Tax=Didymella rabiei TaxID=5454 RepID=UPI0021FB78FB|nr:uncharacterized protein EKO05_0005885 [Ascochyta rabiei]UPX15438.1 hypothetical protein EKO05_0005885 [Ascochyta rabiei]